ncbi:MAG: acylneuraminate cytidylyltransferase family protein [Solirubrobacteraceae bacterium]
MRCLAIIPARGGSSGISRKNLALLAGRPLIAHTCSAAQASTRLEGAIVSTDDAEIAAVAEAHGVEAPFLRPAALAVAAAPMLPVLVHALDWLRDERGTEPDVVVLLQPTSPLRTGAHIDGALAALAESGADAVVSVVAVPHNYTPDSLLELDETGLIVRGSTGPQRRQDKPVLYARNGPAVYAARIPQLRERGDLYGGSIVGYRMSRLDSIDVDDASDLALCSAVLLLRGC